MEEKINMNDMFIIRAVNEKNNDYVITMGDHLASPIHYNSYEDAENSIESTDWNLVASMCMAMIHGYEKMKQSKEEEIKE